ncbi:MAG: glutamine--fructose-6-phosphate transaminase (isomerizing) [Candidatus Omnitrophica bacterium]|nr:glutamine--fructose-6-phosphate transaminase (isomerizing) [Candidatus Omnitrophota bacterium]
MCGIAGYTGKKLAAQVIIAALKKLEHRGYDSCGVCFVNEKKLQVIKTIGKIHTLEQKIHSLNNKSTTAIGHTRWATHGKVSIENTHPHTDCTNRIAVVHNGIIENFREVKRLLTNHKFCSETDTEVIPHLIESYIEQGKNNKDAFFMAIQQLKGSFAIAAVFSDEDKIYFSQKHSSLIIYRSNNETYLVSDPLGLPDQATTIIQVNDGEWGIISSDEICLFDSNGKEKKPEVFTLNREISNLPDHFFLKEILQQPQVILSSIRNTIFFLDIENRIFNGVEKILLTGCGTSYHAALIGKYYFEKIARIDSHVEYASELAHHPELFQRNTMVIALSQSGETRDTVAAVKKMANKKILAITNVEGSLLSRLTPYKILMGAGPEISVAATKSFIAQLICLYILSFRIAAEKNLLSFSEIDRIIVNIVRTSHLLEKFLQRRESLKNLAESLVDFNNFFILGRGVSYPVALEAALKFKEVAYVHAEGLCAAEMKHGPLALISENTPVFFIAPEDNTFDKNLNNIEEIKSRGGRVIAITSEGINSIEKIAKDIVFVPFAEDLSPIFSIVPFQLLSYFLAVRKNLPVDRPRNLAKTVTVE